MFKRFKSNASVNIIVSNILFILYILFVAFPFLAVNQPPDESTSKWTYDYAPVHYAMIYFPVFALYMYSILKNILNVKHIRKLIYPLVFIMLFIAIHMVFFVFSMTILWFCLITVPVGFLTLIATEIFAINFDNKDDKEITDDNINKNNNKNIQKVLNITGCFIIPLLLVCFTVFLHYDITVLKPQMAQQAEQQKFLNCDNNKKVIQTAIKNTGINLNNASIEEITQKFQKEFSNKDKYKLLLGRNYDMVESMADSYYSEIKFLSKYKDGYMVSDIYSFERKGKCNKFNDNCIWNTFACKIYIDENNKIINR